ncbi:hypothetical protein PP639_gp065 [Arthrobacter phage Seahorse]|uniref:Uncharacterized protein n=1 Tax=Arthrobacter phage Seahorse TaxID=2419611 RepID=A0A3G3M544_9CAUD|nr:hypothetical protein PP639_gp065 [Arthrobacter phage Seahorse]AYR01565.1 hypothetical protein PBI_SEAHORSE_65 [Arthrobacter phage Seahorse]
MNRIFDARRKPIPLDLPEPLPAPSKSDAAMLHDIGMPLDEWMAKTDNQRADIRWKYGLGGVA